jgi:hypothetical protein
VFSLATVLVSHLDGSALIFVLQKEVLQRKQAIYMGDLFSNVSEDSSITVIFEQEMELDGIRVLYRKWHGEGITGDDIFFRQTDVRHLVAEELEELIRSSAVGSQWVDITIQPDGDYVRARCNVHDV